MVIQAPIEEQKIAQGYVVKFTSSSTRGSGKGYEIVATGSNMHIVMADATWLRNEAEEKINSDAVAELEASIKKITEKNND